MNLWRPENSLSQRDHNPSNAPVINLSQKIGTVLPVLSVDQARRSAEIARKTGRRASLSEERIVFRWDERDNPS
jgi:hypothetical protein